MLLTRVIDGIVLAPVALIVRAEVVDPEPTVNIPVLRLPPYMVLVFWIVLGWVPLT